MSPEFKDLLQLGFSFAVAGTLLFELLRVNRSMTKVLESQAASLPQIVSALQAVRDDLKEQGKLLIQHAERADAAIRQLDERG